MQKNDKSFYRQQGKIKGKGGKKSYRLKQRIEP
jgi:hypothetical protein